MKKDQCHYPSLNQIRCHLGIEDFLSDNISSDSDSNSNGAGFSKYRVLKRVDSESDLSCASNIARTVLSPTLQQGMYPSMGNNNELFGIGDKGIDILEKGIAPLGLGKRTIHIF